MQTIRVGIMKIIDERERERERERSETNCVAMRWSNSKV